MTEMNEGARRANEQMRHHGERLDRETTIKLLREIRDSLARIEEMIKPHPPIIKKITPDIVPLDDGGLAQKAQKHPKEDEVPELPPSDEGELLEMNR